MKNILAFAGSNNSQSINRNLLDYAARHIQEHQVTTINLEDFSAPVYGIDREKEQGIPTKIKELKELFNSHDAFLLAIPEHNGFMPAVLKNTLDWISRTEGKIFGEKKVMLLSTSPGKLGGANSLAILKNLMPWWGAEIVGDYSLGSFYEHMKENKLREEEHEKLASALRVFEESLSGVSQV